MAMVEDEVEEDVKFNSLQIIPLMNTIESSISNSLEVWFTKTEL